MGRILKEPPRRKPQHATPSSGRIVTAKEPNHVWHIDLKTVPTSGGFWTTWLPFALPRRWPFCWWVAVVVDHFSRRIVGVHIFAQRPNCRTAYCFLGHVIRRAGAAPTYIIYDRESIFDCDAFRRGVKRKGIQPPRYGAVGKHGSIAVLERLILTIKDECTRRISVPLGREAFRHQLVCFTTWYNEFRPHMTLGGRTPHEVYFGQRPANRQPRIEPRKHWPRSSPCANPRTFVAGQPGDRFTLQVDYHHGKRHLPLVTLRRAA